MQGKIHPYWFIPSSNVPYTHIVNLCKITNPDPNTFSTLKHIISISINGQSNQTSISVSNTNFNATEDVYVSLTFNSKVPEFELTEMIKNGSGNNAQIIFHRVNNIKCYFLDDFNITETLTPSDNSLALSDLNNLYDVDYQGVSINTENKKFISDGFTYIGRRFKSDNTFIYEIDPHSLAENKNITNYDFALIKFIQWNNTQGSSIPPIADNMAIISDYNYYPMGDINSNYEYWLLLSKADNERLYFVRSGGYYGVGIREIQYLKL